MNLIDNSIRLITSHELTNTLLAILWHWIATLLPTRYSQKHYNPQMKVLSMSLLCLVTHCSLYLIFFLSIDLNWRCLLCQPIILEIPKKADMENWMYHLQGRAVGEIQLVSS